MHEAAGKRNQKIVHDPRRPCPILCIATIARVHNQRYRWARTPRERVPNDPFDERNVQQGMFVLHCDFIPQALIFQHKPSPQGAYTSQHPRKGRVATDRSGMIMGLPIRQASKISFRISGGRFLIAAIAAWSFSIHFSSFARLSKYAACAWANSMSRRSISSLASRRR